MRPYMLLFPFRLSPQEWAQPFETWERLVDSSGELLGAVLLSLVSPLLRK